MEMSKSITCSHIWHTDTIIFESLVKIQHLEHETERQLCTKIPNKRNKIEKRSITYSHIWRVNTPKCMY